MGESCLPNSDGVGSSGPPPPFSAPRRRWGLALAGLLLATLALAGAGRREAAPAEIEPVSALVPAAAKVKATLPGEPIAYVGHGAFFDRRGRQVVPTADFVTKAQRWYRERLLANVDAKTKSEFATFERRLLSGVGLDVQTNLVVKQRALEWLASRVSPSVLQEGRLLMKLNALRHRLRWQLPRRNDLELLRSLEPFVLPATVASKLRLPEFEPGRPALALATSNSGSAYLTECSSYDVPIPPPIGVLDSAGTAGWRSLGFIPTAEQFIVGTPAEVREFHSADGVCIALPRYSDSTLTTVDLDGVICLSQITSKVCFWDNQMSGLGFSYSSGDQIPIGVADLSVDSAGRYQGGGAEIEYGSGGTCTDCHAGENPYIIHPDSDLGSVLFGDLADPPYNLPMFAPNRYDPIVGASWPQNSLSHSQSLVPASCGGCHTLGGSGGRFPHLSDDLPGYCGILAEAITDTMPPSSPGSQAGTTAITDFQDYCDTDPSAGPANRGDPHLYTTNGIQYDFQAAGEFTSLRNSATGFELQTRQTPVLTDWTPSPNAHTGLASCPSLNTAAALRVGGRRITYQPRVSNNEAMVLRIDGHVVTLPSSGINLGGGNTINTTTSGSGIDVQAADGTRVIITPHYWSSEGYWYLNVEVANTPAREGTMGPILSGEWLPRSPTGGSFGPAPFGQLPRHLLLNQTFADAWRVTNTTSLFDYAPGTSTATFTERAWPPPPGNPCNVIPSRPWPGGGERRPVRPMARQLAESYCRIVEEDPEAFEDCVFDLTATGNADMANAYRLILDLRATL